VLDQRCTGVAIKHQQYRLPFAERQAWPIMQAKLVEIIENGGEGLIIRSDAAAYAVKRPRSVVKIKPRDTDVATVLGTVAGTGRLTGMLGALSVQWEDKCFEVGTGFSDADRRLNWVAGTQIIIEFRGLTKHGIPCEASYKGIS